MLFVTSFTDHYYCHLKPSTSLVNICLNWLNFHGRELVQALYSNRTKVAMLHS
jgi:hypothetical protein